MVGPGTGASGQGAAVSTSGVAGMADETAASWWMPKGHASWDEEKGWAIWDDGCAHQASSMDVGARAVGHAMPAIRQRDEAREDVAEGRDKRARRNVAPPVPSDHLPVRRLGAVKGWGLRAKAVQGAGRGSNGGQRGMKEVCGATSRRLKRSRWLAAGGVITDDECLEACTASSIRGRRVVRGAE